MPTTKPKVRSAARRVRGGAEFAPERNAITQEDIDAVVARVRRLTMKERIQSLIDCGILTKSGKRLAKPYRAE